MQEFGSSLDSNPRPTFVSGEAMDKSVHVSAQSLYPQTGHDCPGGLTIQSQRNTLGQQLTVLWALTKYSVRGPTGHSKDCPVRNHAETLTYTGRHLRQPRSGARTPSLGYLPGPVKPGLPGAGKGLLSLPSGARANSSQAHSSAKAPPGGMACARPGHTSSLLCGD